MGFEICIQYGWYTDVQVQANKLGSPFFVKLGFTSGNSDKVWTICREEENGVIFSKYGRRGSDLRLGNTFTNTGEAFKKLIEKLNKGYAFECGWVLRHPSDTGGLPEVDKIGAKDGLGYELLDKRGEVIALVPHHVKSIFEVILTRKFPPGFISYQESL